VCSAATPSASCFIAAQPALVDRRRRAVNRLRDRRRIVDARDRRRQRARRHVRVRARRSPHPGQEVLAVDQLHRLSATKPPRSVSSAA